MTDQDIKDRLETTNQLLLLIAGHMLIGLRWNTAGYEDELDKMCDQLKHLAKIVEHQNK